MAPWWRKSLIDHAERAKVCGKSGKPQVDEGLVKHVVDRRETVAAVRSDHPREVLPHMLPGQHHGCPLLGVALEVMAWRPGDRDVPEGMVRASGASDLGAGCGTRATGATLALLIASLLRG